MALDETRVLCLNLGEIALCLPVPDAIARKDEVHFFEGALVGLWIKRPHGDDAEGVNGAKNVERLFVELVKDGWEKQNLIATLSIHCSMVSPLNIIKGGGGTYTPTVTDGPTNNTPSIALGAHLQRENLGRIQPGHCQPGGTKDCRVEKDEEGCRATDLGAVGVVCVDCGPSQAAGSEHADALADGAPVESPAAADAVKCEDANEGSKLEKITDVSHRCSPS